MKKTVNDMKKAAAALLMGGLLASCTGDETVAGAPAAGERTAVTLSAQIADDAAGGGTTRSVNASPALSSADLYTQFLADKNVLLYIPDAYRLNGETPVLQSDAAGITATTTNPTHPNLRQLTLANEPYYWPIDNTLSFYAFYPHNLFTGSRTGDDVTLTVSSDQGALAAPTLTLPAGLDADVLYAESKDVQLTSQPVPLTFRHQMSKVTFVLQSGTGVQSSELSSASVELEGVYLSGKLKRSTGAISAITNDATNYPKGTVQVKKTSEATSLTHYCLLPPGQTLTGALVHITIGGRQLDYTIPQYNAADVTLAAGQNYQYTLSVSTSAITAMSHQILPWSRVLQADETLSIDYAKTPLTIEALQAGAQVSFAANKYYRTQTNGVWSAWSGPVSATTFTLSNVGDKVQFWGTAQGSDEQKFTMSGGYMKAYGNIMSLENSLNWDDLTIDIAGAYRGTFNGCTYLKDASCLVLPATTLKDKCYWCMFYGCSNLEKGPALLPALTLTPGCYSKMFQGCSKLVKAPALPAKTLPGVISDEGGTYGCYHDMFNGCKALTAVPDLPATKLGAKCYAYMFLDCDALTTLPDVLPATEMAELCYAYMFEFCDGLTSIPKAGLLPATTLAPNCYQGMFSNCTQLLTVAEDLLPATTLASGCYYNMFVDAAKLTTPPELPATSLATDCYRGMLARTKVNVIKIASPYQSDSNKYNLWLQGTTTGGTIYVKSANYSSWAGAAAGESGKSNFTLAVY